MSLFCRLFPGRRNPQAPEGAFLLRYSGSGALFHATDIRPFPIDKTSSLRRRNPFLPAGISFSGYTAALLCPGDMPFFPLRRSSPDGALSFLWEQFPTESRPDLTHILCNPFRTLPGRAPPGAGLDLRLFSSYLYIPGHTAVLSCQKEHKKDRDPPCQSFPVSLTTKYRTVTGRDVPL